MAAHCKSCGAEVIWLDMKPGSSRMPVDAQPDRDGNVMADLDARVGIVLRQREIDVVRDETPDEPLYQSHFATCPDAQSWRRSKR